jgi:hypothetical protein
VRTVKNATSEGDDYDDDDDTDYSNLKPPVLFVDGYNMIGYRNRNKGGGGLGNDLEEARSELIRDLGGAR